MPRCTNRMPELNAMSEKRAAVVSSVPVGRALPAVSCPSDSGASILRNPYAEPLVHAAHSVLHQFDENIGLGDQEFVPFVFARRIASGDQDAFVAIYDAERGDSPSLVMKTEQSPMEGSVSQCQSGTSVCPNAQIDAITSVNGAERDEIMAGIRILGRLVIAATPAPPLTDISPASTVERRWMKLADFAVRHDYSLSTVKHWRRLGLPTNGIDGRGVRVNVSEGDAWLAAGGPRLAIAAAGACHGRRGRQ